MTQPTTTQQDLDRQQLELNDRRAAEQARQIKARHDLAKQVQVKLDGVPMHSTNVGEVALVVVAVFELMAAKHDNPQQRTAK